MKLIYNLCIVAALLIADIAYGAEFIAGTDDIPLPDGAKQIHSADIDFGNNEIRFNESYITSKKLSATKVLSFYRETLPQMGWNFKTAEENALHFERDMEILDIVIEKNKPLLIRITLKSKD